MSIKHKPVPLDKFCNKTCKDGARPHTLPNFWVVLCIFCVLCIFVLFYVFLCCSMYCLFCDLLCIVCVYMCTELLPPSGYPISVKYIISYIISSYIISYQYPNVSLLHSECFCTAREICNLPNSATIFEATWWLPIDSRDTLGS
jgi:hypothetical protein